MKFELDGARLHGRFVLIGLKPRPKEHAENWLLIEENGRHEREGVDAAALEAEISLPQPASQQRPKETPIAGAVRGRLPKEQTPQ